MVAKKPTTKEPSAIKRTPPLDKPNVMQAHELVLSSNTLNAVSIAEWGKFVGAIELQALVNDLGDQTQKVKDGDMGSVEGMLYRQAKTLETMFTSLARRAVAQDGLTQFQTYLTLALKTQAQCRSTLEALAEIKNPRSVAFVKQANIANGPQQVNNGQRVDKSAYARKRKTDENELLEDVRHGATHLDRRTTAKATGSNSTVEAMEGVQRTKKR